MKLFCLLLFVVALNGSGSNSFAERDPEEPFKCFPVMNALKLRFQDKSPEEVYQLAKLTSDIADKAMLYGLTASKLGGKQALDKIDLATSFTGSETPLIIRAAFNSAANAIQVNSELQITGFIMMQFLAKKFYQPAILAINNLQTNHSEFYKTISEQATQMDAFMKPFVTAAQQARASKEN